MYCTLLCTLDLVFLIGNRSLNELLASFFPASYFHMRGNDVQLQHVLCSVMYTSCLLRSKYLTSYKFSACFSPRTQNACQSSEFDLKRGQGSCAPCFLFRFFFFWVCVSFHEPIPLPVFHASPCWGSRILAARWRHQSVIWTCSKFRALGRFCHLLHHLACQ